LLFLALVAHGQEPKRIAIVHTEDDGEPPLKHTELSHLTDRLREIAINTLPQKSYAIMTQQTIVDFLGSPENMIRICKEANGCLAKIGRKVNADYVGQARIGRFGKDLSINVELYESGRGTLVSSITGQSKDIYGLLSVLDEKAPDLYKKLFNISGSSQPIYAKAEKISSSSGGSSSSLSIGESGILTDSRDRKIYKTIKIGNKTWMAENLSYNANGSKCCANQESNCQKYGKLYDWKTAVKSCPAGWHLPSNEEWQTLVNGWKQSTDDFGFAALPGGYDASGRGSGDYCIEEGVRGSWWSSTELNSNAAGRWGTSGYENSIKAFLCSVRCVRD